MTSKVKKSDSEWKKELAPEVYAITRDKGTERAFTGKYYQHKGQGMYRCACCGNELFKSAEKYDSGSGWPSFWQPSNPEAVETDKDRSFGMIREEVVCSSCEAHLGHVFPDGPQPTGMRYCINSAALDFEPEDKEESADEDSAS